MKRSASSRMKSSKDTAAALFRPELMVGSSSSPKCNLPPPPASLPTNNSLMDKSCPNAECGYEFDCSTFATESYSSTTVASSLTSLSTLDSSNLGLIKGWGSTLSRGRCVSNLSALGSVASETSIPRSSTYETSPNEASWGYFVDTPYDI